MIATLLYELNHAPIWQREVNLWERRVRAASLDRLFFLVLHRFGWTGSDEVQLLRRLVQPGMRIIDLGANVGLYSSLLAHLSGEAAKFIPLNLSSTPLPPGARTARPIESPTSSLFPMPPARQTIFASSPWSWAKK